MKSIEVWIFFRRIWIWSVCPKRISQNESEKWFLQLVDKAVFTNFRWCVDSPVAILFQFVGPKLAQQTCISPEKMCETKIKGI